MRKSNSEFNSSFVSEPGTFITNKSYFGFVELDDMACWIAADGLDSDEEKESAKIAVHRIFESFMAKPTLSKIRIQQYIQNAHNLLAAESRNVRLKVSLVMLVTDYSKIVWAVAGNTRMYHFRRGIFSFRSKDQTLAQLMADSDKINEEEISYHEERNNLTNYLGKSAGFKPFISGKYRLADGDVVLLCNCGFWENMTNEDIALVLPESKDAEELVDNLEDMLLSKQNETLNNYTIAAIFANRVFKENTTDYQELGKRVAMIAIPILLFVGIGLLIRGQMEKAKEVAMAKAKAIAMAKKKKTVDQHIATGDQHVAGENFQQAVIEYKAALEMLNQLNQPEKKATVERKLAITEDIVYGDNLFTTNQLPKALEFYTKAQKLANGFPYDQVGLAARINKVKNTVDMNNLIRQGDLECQRRNFAVGIEKYQEAKTLAEQLQAQDKSAMLDTKINNAEQKQNVVVEKDNQDQKQAQDIRQAKVMERTGDQKYAAKKREEALNYFNLAKQTYERYSLSEDIARITEKITNAKKKGWLTNLFKGGAK